MTRQSFKRIISVSLLGLTFLNASSATIAGEHEMWKEQVQTTADARTTLTVSSRQVTSTDNTMWREQRKGNTVAKAGVTYITKVNHNRHLLGSDNRLWREHVQPTSNTVIENLASLN